MRKSSSVIPVRMLIALFCAATALVSVACVSARSESLEGPPETAPPVIGEEEQPQEAQPDSEPAQVDEPVEEVVEAATELPLTVVIADEQGDSAARRSLVAAAREERQRRQDADPPKIVITDENLAEHATGELTVAGGDQGEGSGEAEKSRSPSGKDEEETLTASEGEETEAAEDEETYWRTRIRQARLNWRTTLEEIEHLENRVAELRRRFYEEDDPFYRDSQIKPSWDQTLERLEEAREAAEQFRIEVEEILEEGRRAGALPGWLREGLELEPAVGREEKSEELPEHETLEPTTVEPKEPGSA